jgi:hypothetical protein
MSDVQLASDLSAQEIEWGLTIVRSFTDEWTDRTRALTGTTVTHYHSAAEDAYSAPGMLREGIFGTSHVDVIGPIGRVHWPTPLGSFRNISGRGHAAYSQAPDERGRVPYYRRLKSGRRVLRYRRVRAALSGFGRAGVTGAAPPKRWTQCAGSTSARMG